MEFSPPQTSKRTTRWPYHGTSRWIPALCGGVAGLYAARLLAETTLQPWRPAWLALASAGCAAGAALVGMRTLSRLRHNWPLLALLVYVLCPATSSDLAVSVLGFTVVLLILLNAPDRLRGAWPEAVAVLLSLALYASTLAPGLLPADAGEFQLVSQVLGIAHPPGYALYTLLGKVLTLVPTGDPAFRVNLLSAIFSSLTVGIVARSVRHTTRSPAMGLLAAGTLAVATTFWVQATTANVRSLTALFTALLLALLLRWEETRSPRQLVAVGACFGLAIGHHASLAPLALPVGAFIGTTDPALLRKPKRWLGPLLALSLSLLVLLYLPLRSLMGAPFDPEPIRSLAEFVEHVSASGFSGDMFYFNSLPDLWARLRVWAQIMNLEFGIGLLSAAAATAVALVTRRGRLAVLFLGCLSVNTVLAVTYRAPQTTEYLMPSYVCLAMVLGHGLGTLQPFPPRSGMNAARAVVAAGLAIAVAWNGATNYPSLLALHHDTSARDYAEGLLLEAPDEALILANWHWATPLWYLQQVEGMRPDVLVEYVYPEGSTPNEEVWLRRLEDAIEQRPVIVTSRYYAFEQSGYTWVPIQDAWLARSTPLPDVPETYSPMEVPFGDGITLLGYRLSSPTLEPGETLTLRVYWRADARITKDYSSFAQLLGPAGVVGQGDIGHQSTRYLPGEVRVDSYSIPILLHATPGDYSLITGFYSVTKDGWERLLADGADHVVLTPIQIRAAADTFATMSPRDIRLANGLQITGTDVDDSVAGQRRLYLHIRQRQAVWPGQALWESTITETRIQAFTKQALVTETTIPALGPGSAMCVALDLPEGVANVRLRFLDMSGRPLDRLGPAHLPIGDAIRLSLPEEDQSYVALGGDMVFLGWRTLPEAVSRGETVSLEPRFLALKPVTADYSVSAGMSRPDRNWEVKSDGTPALGAIPTLKWVRGWQVTDPHALAVSDDAPTGSAALTLTIYDAFTLEPLNVLDERLVRAGQGVTLCSGEITIVE